MSSEENTEARTDGKRRVVRTRAITNASHEGSIVNEVKTARRRQDTRSKSKEGVEGNHKRGGATCWGCR
jgi:hypothetical protein